MTGELVPIVIAALAGWRLAVMLVMEEGPARVFVHIRDWSKGPKGGDYRPRRFFAGILGCVWCMSVWVTTAAWLVLEYVATAPVVVAAAWGAALLCERIVTKGDSK